MSNKMNNCECMYITSACISGPIVEGINYGPCVNEEYINNDINEQIEKIRYDIECDIEETKHEYSNEELNAIYKNNYSQIFNRDTENQDIWRNLDFEMEKEYLLMMEKDMREQELFEKEEEDYYVALERCIGF